MSVFTRLGGLAVARPKVVLAATAAFFALAGLAGSGVVNHLSTGGFDDTNSQATRAQRTLERVFGQGNPDIVLMVKAKRGGVDDAAVAAEGTALTRELASQPGVTQAASYWSLAACRAVRFACHWAAAVASSTPSSSVSAFSR